MRRRLLIRNLPAPGEWCSPVAKQCQKRVLGLSEQPRDCSDSPLGLAIALWISWAARQAINLCKSLKLLRAVLGAIGISGILYLANIALSVAMMLAEEADVSFLSSRRLGGIESYPV